MATRTLWLPHASLWLGLAIACSTPANEPADNGVSGGGGGVTTTGGGAGLPSAGAGGSGATAGRAATGGAAGTSGGVGGSVSSGGSGAAAGSGATAGGATAGGGTGGSGVGGGAGVGGSTGGASGGLGGAGAGGSGGMAGGNAGDAGGGGAAGGAPKAPCDIGGKILCDDFDAVPAGMLPTGAPWAAQNCFDTSHTLKVDGAAHHSGSQSLVGQNIPYADCQLHADLGASLTEYWVRAWVYFGAAAPTASTHEVTVFELVPSASTDDPSIRIGYRGDTCMPIGVELNITGGGQEETGCTGSIPAADTWYCYVLHVKQAASSVTTDLSIDDVAQTYTNHGQPQTEITSGVANVRYLRVGPRSYSGNYATPIYLDDVAVATQALTCK